MAPGITGRQEIPSARVVAVAGAVDAVVAIVAGAVHVVAVVSFHHRTREGGPRSGLRRRGSSGGANGSARRRWDGGRPAAVGGSDRRRQPRVREWMRLRDRGPVSGEHEWIRGGCGETGGLHASQAAQYQAENPSVNSTRPKFFGCRLVPKSPKSKNFGLQSKRGLKPHRIDRISAV